MNRFSATLLGALLGLGLGMVLAPRSGAQTRERLRRSWEDLQGETQERLSQGRMRMTELIRSGQERVDELSRRGEEEIPEQIARTRGRLDAASERIEGTLSGEGDSPLRGD